ncbi:MAG: c-type cytochrome biogenesis protein CcsB, partial [Desulfobacterales bacterium]|nr:c-type cytochrome biogenesis protein CcsB [Desulfobacterales bacterium]
MESIILISIILYLLSMAGYFAFLFIQKDYFQRAGFFLLLVGFLFHTLTIVYGFIKAGHVPVSNMHETLSFAGWAIAGVFLSIQYKFNLK